MTKVALLSTLLITAFTIPAALAVPITVTYNYIGARAIDDATGSNNQTYSGTTIPATQILTANTGNSSNTTGINYSGDTSSAVLSVDVLNNINNNVNGYGCCDIAQSYSTLYFTADVNTGYSISGFYDTLSSSGTGTFLDVYLQDITTGSMLFREMSYSQNIINESFVLDGVAEGNYSSILLGTLTGNLIAGNSYRFSFNSYIQAYSGGETTSVASANGNVTLGIERPIATSEPSLLALMAIGLLAMVVVRKRVEKSSENQGGKYHIRVLSDVPFLLNSNHRS